MIVSCRVRDFLYCADEEEDRLVHALRCYRAQRARRFYGAWLPLGYNAREEMKHDDSGTPAERTPEEELEAEAALINAMIEQQHREQVDAMATRVEAAILESLDGFPWRRSLAVITDACQAVTQRFRDEAAATPPD